MRDDAWSPDFLPRGRSSRRIRQLPGGFANPVWLCELDDGADVVVKASIGDCADMFAAEAAGPAGTRTAGSGSSPSPARGMRTGTASSPGTGCCATSASRAWKPRSKPPTGPASNGSARGLRSQHARILNLRQLLAMLAAGIPIPAIAGSIRELISTYA